MEETSPLRLQRRHSIELIDKQAESTDDFCMFPLECSYFWAPDNVDRIKYEDLSVLPDEDVHAKAIALATKVKALEQ